MMRIGFPSSAFIATWLTVLFLAVLPKGAFACPGCSEFSEQVAQAEPDTVMAGFAFSWSVLFMLGFVLLVIGLFTAYIVKTVRRLDNE